MQRSYGGFLFKIRTCRISIFHLKQAWNYRGAYGVLCNTDPTVFLGNPKCIDVSKETGIGGGEGVQTILLVLRSLEVNGQGLSRREFSVSTATSDDGNNFKGNNSGSSSSRNR